MLALKDNKKIRSKLDNIYKISLSKKDIDKFEDEIVQIIKNFEFNDEIYLGIRPEDISIKKDHEIQVDVKIDHVENLGFEKIIYSKVLENQIIIKSSENINNNSLKVSFSKDKVLFFDKDKNRIR